MRIRLPSPVITVWRRQEAASWSRGECPLSTLSGHSRDACLQSIQSPILKANRSDRARYRLRRTRRLGPGDLQPRAAGPDDPHPALGVPHLDDVAPAHVLGEPGRFVVACRLDVLGSDELPAPQIIEVIVSRLRIGLRFTSKSAPHRGFDAAKLTCFGLVPCSISACNRSCSVLYPHARF